MNGAEAIAQAVVAHGLHRVFSHAGGTISRILDAIDQAGVQVVVAANEAQAGHMAQGASRVAGKTQVALVTSGPGLTNVLTSVADSYFDADAVAYLSGQVATSSLRGGRPIRQMGFQECDAVSMATPVTKWAVRASVGDDLGALVGYALRHAEIPRPGPCLVDIPMDLAASENGNRGRSPDAMLPSPRPATPSQALPSRAPPGRATLDDIVLQVAMVLDMIRTAKRPLVIAGRGCLSAPAQLRSFVAKYQIPVVTSLPAVGVVPDAIGFLGHTGHEAANRAVRDADVLLVLGARLDVRVTGTLTEEWARGKTIISVDYDVDELAHRRVRVDRAFNCSVIEWLQVAASL